MGGFFYLWAVALLQFITVDADIVPCPSTGQHFFPHPYTCSQFVECNGGDLQVVDCMPGTHFNPELGWCDFPENVGCVDSTPAPPPTEEPNVGGPVGDCPAENGVYVDFLVDSKYCDVFYKCVWGTPVRMQCAPNEYWNPDKNVCDWQSNVNCGSNSAPDEENDDDNSGGISDEVTEDDVPNEDEFPDEGSGDVTEEEIDDGNGDIPDDIPNEEDVSAESSDEVDNGNDGGLVCPEVGQYFFPHPYVCSQFIECNDGRSTVVDCIPGLHFDPQLGWCDFPENVGCVDSTPAPPTTEAPIISGPVGECPSLNEGYVTFLTDAQYCDVYYMCDWGTPVQKQCPPGLYFNPTLNVCDWPQDAGCTAGQ